MLVVDTNVVTYFYLEPSYLPLLHELLDHDRDWIAPTLWRSELRNVLTLYLRKGLLDMEKAVAVMAAAEGVLGSQEYCPASDHILTLAQNSGCSAYDCEFVALARELGTLLVTYDSKLLVAFPSLALTPAAFIALTG